MSDNLYISDSYFNSVRFRSIGFQTPDNKIRQHKAFLPLDVHLNIKQGFHQLLFPSECGTVVWHETDALSGLIHF